MSREILFPNGQVFASLTYIETSPGVFEPWDGNISVSSSGSAIEDGVDSAIKATVIESTDEPGVFGLVSLNPDGSNISGGSGGGTVNQGNGGVSPWLVTGPLTDTQLRATPVPVSGTVAVSAIAGALPAGNNNIGDVDIASSALPANAAIEAGGNLALIAASASVLDDWDESDRAKVNLIVGQAGVQGAAGASTANTQRVAIATDANAVTAVGTAADDLTTPGAPVMIGGTGKSPDGTDPGNVSAEDDVTRLITNLNRRLLVEHFDPSCNTVHFDGSSQYTDQTIAADPGAGFAIVIDFINFSSGAATAINLFLEEGSTKIWGPIYLEAVAGRGYVSGPIRKRCTAHTAVTFTTSANIAQSVDIGYHTEKV